MGIPAWKRVGEAREMDVVRGSLEDISRPAAGPRSRPGSRASCQATVGALEVLTPELCPPQQWSVKMPSQDGRETPRGNHPEKPAEDDNPPSSAHPAQGGDTAKLHYSDQSEESVSTEMPQNAEETFEPKVVKAIKRMKALDELLLKKVAKEKEVKAEGILIRKQLWEELQNVSLQSSPRSHEENINTNKFLALTPPLDDGSGDTSAEMFLPVFSTQLLLEEHDDNNDEDEATASQGNAFLIENSELINSSDRSHQKTKQYRNVGHKKGIDFIQRNIELLKDAGSQVLLMDDEKLRLEQLLGDLEDGFKDEDITSNISLWLVPGEGYTPEPGELEQLEKIEARLQMFSSTPDTTEASDCDHSVPSKHSKSDVSAEKSVNPVAPGEKVLRYTKELREQKIRLKEIDQQLEDIERSSTTPIVISRYSSPQLKSDSFISWF